ncbi:MAG: hypothetical protein PXY39_02975 [archaeon]|nr:hypothetical protein [archaeon]
MEFSSEISDALAEYDSSLHNEDTEYNYHLILFYFFTDLGIAKDATQHLREKLSNLENGPKERMKKEAYRDHLEEIRRVKENILRIQANTFIPKAKKDPQWAYEIIKNWFVKVQAIVKAKRKSQNTVNGYIRPIAGICEMNWVPLTSAHWKKIVSKLGKGRLTGKDRAYSVEEIRTLSEYGDKRVKPIALTQTSCGCRVGAFHYLNLGHIRPVFLNADGSFEEGESLGKAPLDRTRKLVAARIVIYADEREENDAPFISPECCRSWDDYANYRRKFGEKITDASPAVRDLFFPDKGARGKPDIPIRLKDVTIKNLILQALVDQGLRPQKLPEGKTRAEVQMDHGMRKFFDTVCDDYQVNIVHSEKMMGHSAALGLKINYNRSEWRNVLLSYLKIVPHLTITEEEIFRAKNEDVSKIDKEKQEDLQKQVSNLKATIDHYPQVIRETIDRLMKGVEEGDANRTLSEQEIAESDAAWWEEVSHLEVHHESKGRKNYDP